MTRTFVPRARAAGCRLVTDTRVVRLRRTNERWTIAAVQRSADQSQREVEIEADSVFVCAGAVQTPALLRRSGVDNIAAALRTHSGRPRAAVALVLAPLLE